MSGVFSFDEMRELALAFPNASAHAFPSTEQETRLIPSLSGDGFLRSDVLLQKLNEAIESEGEGRLPLSQLATSFDIAKDELAILVKEPNAELLLSTDMQNVVSKAEADRLQENLKELVEGQVLYAAGVAIANNLALESIYKLISMNRYGAKGDDENIPRLALHPETNDPREIRKAIIFSPSHLEDIVAEARAAFQEAQEAGVAESVPQDGVLPTPFLQLIVNRLGSSFDGRYNISEGTVDFTPTSCLQRQREEKLEGLIDGTIPSCSLQWFVDLMPEQYPDISSAERYIRTNHAEDILIFFDTAVSKTWHENVTQDLLKILEEKSLVNVSDPFQDLSPDAAREAAAKAHTDMLSTIRAIDESSIICEGFFPYLIHTNLFNRIQSTFTAAVRAHATHLWTHSSPTTPESDLPSASTLDLPTILSPAATTLSLPPPLLPILLRCSCDGNAKSTFTSTIATLELQSDAALATFWHDRVSSRFELYALGATSIPDAKLRAALCDLLRDYVIRDLVPDAAQRAESKNLIRSARARRSVRKLGAALAEPGVTRTGGEQAVVAVRACLGRFAAKMDVPGVGAEEIAQRKEALVKEMVRGMQKDADAPRLFLTLVVVLWARRGEGVVYATGKFAPKVVRLLKAEGVLAEAQLEKVEALKDLAKAGGVGDQEREEMRRLALEAWQV
ncbi:hypothetical protein B0J12DRAFT_737946 [Macrophomina phaseolina]|uniref:Uncharacterized protein n=1 Tax=Macrophomina phaseolina TaxID=35725 RepID=A0ABQ8GLQ9_9PEZI|nr:hypothetical protein B0J12DRAFT_737946 [Macrophomina phaseolina]